MKLKNPFKNLGPGILVTAAFIGPGTITVCTLSGVQFGYALLWGLVFSMFATIVLQEMTVRLGLVGQKGLGEALRSQFERPWARISAIVLVLSAIFIGNSAYETGNILGASLGMIELTGISMVTFGGVEISVWGPVIGLAALGILLIGTYKSLERILVGLVITMSLAFVLTMLIVGPAILPILNGMFVPALPKGSIFMLIGLIGTTVVPYNLFLHASVVQQKWKTKSDLKVARNDLIFSILLGGFVSMSVVITSAATFFGTAKEIQGASDLASQLRPLLGNLSGIFMSLGLFAAGISSAITAPLAAAFATTGILGWSQDMKSARFKAVWMIVLLVGIVFSAFGFSPIQAIWFAQVANGILLPVIAVYLLLVMNKKQLLGDYTNKPFQNILGILVVLVMIGLGLKSILQVIGVF